MDVAIIISCFEADQNIKRNLIQLGFKESEEKYEDNVVYKLQNIRMYETSRKCIDCEGIDNEIEADLFVFATRHSGSSGKASLTCHSPGNWNKAELGGKERQLCVAPALYLKEFFLNLSKYQNVEADITLEVTHHGPYLKRPCMFVEIGSKVDEWINEEYGKIIAECIIKSFSKNITDGKSAILIGGMHYSQSGNKIMENSDYAIGHICPKYMLEHLDEQMLRQALEKTTPSPEIILLDWKGMGKEKQRIINILDKLKLNYEKSNKVIKCNKDN